MDETKDVTERVDSGDESEEVHGSIETESVDVDVDVPKEPGNVRTRVEQLVKSKFVGIVNEIRKNSPPLVVKRWVDTTTVVTSGANHTDESVNEEERHEDPNSIKEIDCSTGQEIVDGEPLSQESPSRTKITSSFTSILTKLNLRPFDKTWESTDTSETGQQATSSITSTFSDFYEKFNTNRDRYQSIKNRKMDIKRMLSRTRVMDREEVQTEPNTEAIKVENNESQVSNEEPETTEPLVEPEVDQIQENDTFELQSTDTNIDWSLKPPSCGPRTNIRKIGRCASEHQPCVSVNRKKALSSIGRSFSVVAPDEVIAVGGDEISGNIYVTIHEGGNSSCPNPSSLHASSRSINALSEASSLNLLSGSLPISPAHTIVTSDDERSVEPRVRKKLLAQDASFQSDTSYCSSVESLLDARKPDPEAILRACGFGPPRQENVISKIPKRFLKPSQVRGIDTNEFLKRQKFANHLHDSSAFGYRGLIGNPHIKPSRIVLKIRERFLSMDVW